MKFSEAKSKLKEIADGQYHSLSYELSEHKDGEIAETCSVYLDGAKSFESNTWEGVFKKLNGGTDYVKGQEPENDI